MPELNSILSQECLGAVPRQAMNVTLFPLDEIKLSMLRTYEESVPKLHNLVDDVNVADLILFLGYQEPDGKGILDNPIVKQFPEKCFIYWDGDGVVALLPGIYVNATTARLFDLYRRESHAFNAPLSPHIYPRPHIEKRYLCSFMGGSTSFVRKRLYKLEFNRPDILIRNTSCYGHWDHSQPGRERQQIEYAEILAASHFGLCPRGASAGSQRLYETMKMGIAPVLISDRFRLPEGAEWEKFLLRIPERKLREIPEILEKHLPEAAERGRLARLAWEQWFAPEVLFNNLVAACIHIRQRRIIPERWMHATWPFLLAKDRLFASSRRTARQVVLGTFRLLNVRFPYELSRRSNK